MNPDMSLCGCVVRACPCALPPCQGQPIGGRRRAGHESGHAHIRRGEYEMNRCSATLRAMTQSAGTENWTIDVPRGWRKKKDDECVRLVPPSEIGSLQLSGHQKDDGNVTDEDLLELATDHLDAGAPRRDVRLGDFMGFEIAYDAEGFACREWYLRHDRTLLFVTYTCALASSGREDEAVELALISLRAL